MSVSQPQPSALVRTEIVKRAIVLGEGLSASVVALGLAGQGFPVDLLMPGNEMVNLALYAFPNENGRIDAAAKMRSVSSSPAIQLHANCLVSSISGCAGDFEITFTEGNDRRRIKGGAIVLAQDPSPSVRNDGGSIVSNSELIGMLENDAKIPMTVVFIEGSGAKGSCPVQGTTASIENALAIKKRRPDGQVYVLARDVSAPGMHERAYSLAMEKGVVFFRGEFSYQASEAEPGSLVIRDPVIGDVMIRPDLIVRDEAFDLSSNSIIARRLGLSLSPEGHVLGFSTRLHPGETIREGVFICHGLGASILASDNITEASAVASSASELLSKDFLEHGEEAAYVDKEKCSACLACVRICPYDAPFIGDKGKAEIRVTSCQGCGMCVSLCPSKAIDQRGWTDGQLRAKTMTASQGAT